MSELEDDRKERRKRKYISRAVNEMRELETAAAMKFETSKKPHGYRFLHKMDLAEIWIYAVYRRKDYTKVPVKIIGAYELIATVPDHILSITELPADIQAALRAIDRDLVVSFEVWLLLSHARNFAVPFRYDPVHNLKRALMVFNQSALVEDQRERILDTFAERPDLPEALLAEIREAQNLLADQIEV